jgi:hypothetical protein
MLKKVGVKCTCGSVVAGEYLEKHQQTRLHFRRLERKTNDVFKRVVGVQKVYF